MRIRKKHTSIYIINAMFAQKWCSSRFNPSLHADQHRFLKGSSDLPSFGIAHSKLGHLRPPLLISGPVPVTSWHGGTSGRKAKLRIHIPGHERHSQSEWSVHTGLSVHSETPWNSEGTREFSVPPGTVIKWNQSLPWQFDQNDTEFA